MFMQAEAQTGTINPAFAGHVSDKLRELSGDLHGVFDNLREIARGDDPKANGYDRIRALKILYDRGCGKVTRNQARTNANGSGNGTATDPEPKPAAAKRQVVQLEQKLDDALGPPQAPAEPDEATNPGVGGEPCPEPSRRAALSAVERGLPAPSPDTPNYTPDLVRDSQYYVLEITNYGDELATLLWDIHQADPDDDTIRSCHRIAAGLMIIDRVIGPVPDYEQPLDHWHDPSLEPNWIYKHPADIDSNVPVEKLVEADRAARRHVEGMRKEREAFQPREETGPCHECTDDYPCEYHAMAEEFAQSEDEDLMIARGMRNLGIFRDRLYLDKNGILRLHPPDYIDDS